jgi:NTE family protein
MPLFTTDQEKDKRRIAIACQGGGSHTACTAGALKKLLMEKPDEYDVVALSGTSGGAICALLAWSALIEKNLKERSSKKRVSKRRNLKKR